MPYQVLVAQSIIFEKRLHNGLPRLGNHNLSRTSIEPSVDVVAALISCHALGRDVMQEQSLCLFHLMVLPS